MAAKQMKSTTFMASQNLYKTLLLGMQSRKTSGQLQELPKSGYVTQLQLQLLMIQATSGNFQDASQAEVSRKLDSFMTS